MHAYLDTKKENFSQHKIKCGKKKPDVAIRPFLASARFIPSPFVHGWKFL